SLPLPDSGRRTDSSAPGFSSPTDGCASRSTSVIELRHGEPSWQVGHPDDAVLRSLRCIRRKQRTASCRTALPARRLYCPLISLIRTFRNFTTPAAYCSAMGPLTRELSEAAAV